MKKCHTYISLVDICVAEPSERVNVVQVLEYLQVGHGRVDRVAHVLELLKRVGQRASIAQINIELDSWISHLCEHVTVGDGANARPSHVSTAEAEAILVDLRCARCIRSADQKRKAVDVARAAACSLDHAIRIGTLLDKLDAELLMNTGHGEKGIRVFFGNDWLICVLDHDICAD